MAFGEVCRGYCMNYQCVMADAPWCVPTREWYIGDEKS